MILKERTHLDFEAQITFLWRDVILIRFLVLYLNAWLLLVARKMILWRDLVLFGFIGVDSFYEIIIRDAFESFLYLTYDYEKLYDWISEMERTNDRMLKNEKKIKFSWMNVILKPVSDFCTKLVIVWRFENWFES